MDVAERMKRAREVLGLGSAPLKKREKKLSRTVSSIKTLSQTMTKSEYNSCAKKVRYSTQGEATWHANRAMTNRPGTKLRVYWCAYCNGWHITHQALMRNERQRNSKIFHMNSEIPANAVPYEVSMSLDTTLDINKLVATSSLFEGIDVHASKDVENGVEVSLNKTHNKGIDFNSGLVKTEIKVPDVKLNDGKIEVFSMLKRTPLDKHVAGDGNPLVYALKHDSSSKYKYFFKDPADEEHVFEMIRESVKQFSFKYFSKIGTSSTTVIVVPSGNSLNSKFAKLASEVIKAVGYSVLMNDSVLAKMTVEDFEDDVLNNPDSDFMFWMYSLDSEMKEHYSELLNSYLKKMKTEHNGLFSYHFVKDPELRNKISISMKVTDKSFENINGYDVLLIDDTISRGATLIEACKNLCNSYSPKSITALTMFSKLEK